MDNVRLIIMLCMMLMCVIEVSSRIFESEPVKFDRKRYERSRNRPVGKPFNPVTNDEKALDFVALVNLYGYPGEEHVVTTIDGYRLRVHRIPGSPSRPKAIGKPVAFLHHGMLASSDMWVLMGPSKDLAYMLADAGYDVWLGNARGNTYSRSHISLSPDYDEDFWRFSFHEIALFDVTATIDYILHETNQSNIVYIGHSMGTTISYILLSTKPEYNEKIRLVVSLSPVASWHKKPEKILNFLVENAYTIKNIFKNGRIYEFLPMTTTMSELAKMFCSNKSVYQKLCIQINYLIVGYNPSQLNTSLVPYILTYLPAGISVQTIDHYSQIIKSEGDFKMFDYGVIQNFAIYKQKNPPSYNLTNIVAPVALLYGKGDTLVPPENAIGLSKKLQNVMTIEAVPDEKFNHLDFLLAREVKELLNNRIIEIITNGLK